MEFREESVREFKSFFERIQPTIEAFEGCQGVVLYRDSVLPHVYYTQSKWVSESDLQSYRKSDFFIKTWKQTKEMFSGKPAAYSLVPPEDQT